MPKANKFPDSIEKQYLREVHLNILAKYRIRIKRDLRYFGLPSADMLDVKLWKNLLQHIVAVEQDTELIVPMYRNATMMGIEKKTTVIEGSLLETVRLLEQDERTAQINLNTMSPGMQKRFQTARSFGFDVVNVDPYGGFVYEATDPDTGKLRSNNAEILQKIINYQARRSTSFFLIVTFELRDTGAQIYLDDINFVLDQLETRHGLERLE